MQIGDTVIEPAIPVHPEQYHTLAAVLAGQGLVTLKLQHWFPQDQRDYASTKNDKASLAFHPATARADAWYTADRAKLYLRWPALSCSMLGRCCWASVKLVGCWKLLQFFNRVI